MVDGNALKKEIILDAAEEQLFAEDEFVDRIINAKSKM